MFEIIELMRAIVLNACETKEDLENYLHYDFENGRIDFNNLNIFVSTDYDFNKEDASHLTVQYVDELLKCVPEYAQKSVEILKKSNEIDFVFSLGVGETARIIIEYDGTIELTTFSGRYFSFRLLDNKLVWSDSISLARESFNAFEYSTDLLINKILDELTKSCSEKNIPLDSFIGLFNIVKPAVVLGLLDFNKTWMESVSDSEMYDDIMNIIDEEYGLSK